jgi:hypothetical protein
MVWSYYNIPSLCWTDDIRSDFKFYHSPLGVDTKLFTDMGLERVYDIFKGFHRNETLHQIDEAARLAHKTAIATKGVSDEELVLTYNQCKYISGLRKIEGFEMPVLEGLLCGARPICYDRKHYRDYFGDLVEYIPETDKADIIYHLVQILQKEPRPVTIEEKNLVRKKFNWATIIKGFWERI